jgi:proteasome lid subunit RPN8/RPN11
VTALPEEFVEPALRLSAAQYAMVVAHCLDGLPYEACGLLVGPIDEHGSATGEIRAVFPCRNADASAVTYTVDSRDMLRSMRAAEEQGDEIVGVWHSHTHTDAFPSATDVRQAVDPGWIYAIVSLRDDLPMLRAYRIRGGEIAEVRVELTD